jgi:hypothetical protein
LAEFGNERGSQRKVIRHFGSIAQCTNLSSAASHREDAVCVEVCVPGQIWEIDIHRDGDVEIEVFRSSGTLLPEDTLPKMIQEFAD